MSVTLVLTSIAISLGALAVLAQALDLWLGREKKARFAIIIKHFHQHYSASDARDSMYFPTFIIGAIYARIFGKRIISSAAFYRSLWLTLGFLVVTLGITGILLKAPFGMTTPPWQFSESSSTIAKQTVAKIVADPRFAKEANKSLAIQAYTTFGAILGSWMGRAIYTLCFGLAVLYPNALLNYATVVINRLFLKEILEHKCRPRAAILMLWVNLFFMAFATSLILVFLGVFAMPALWPVVVPLFVAAIGSPGLFMILLEIAIMAAWGLCSTWLKVSACITLIPTTSILLSVLIGYVGRKYIKIAIVGFIDRGLEYERGFLAYIAVGLGIIAGAISILIKLL
jgi:hypothetical protein